MNLWMLHVALLTLFTHQTTCVYICKVLYVYVCVCVNAPIVICSHTESVSWAGTHGGNICGRQWWKKITPRQCINLRRDRRAEGSVWERRLLQLFAWNRSERDSLVRTRHTLPYVCTFIYFRADAVFVEVLVFAICMQNKFLLMFHLCVPSDNVWASKLALSFCFVFFFTRNFLYNSNMNLLYIQLEDVCIAVRSIMAATVCPPEHTSSHTETISFLSAI